jgi:hypothetical protein
MTTEKTKKNKGYWAKLAEDLLIASGSGFIIVASLQHPFQVA